MPFFNFGYIWFYSTMSRKHKFHEKDGLYFVSFATVNWVDVFVRYQYCDIVVSSLDYCRKNLGMEIYAWCIMPSHVHLLFRAANNNPEIIIGRLKEHTSKSITKAIENNLQESRREWLLAMFERAAENTSNVKYRQFWQHHNKPILLWTSEVIDQKLEYIHQNPVAAGLVTQPEHWKYSSAGYYAEMESMLEIDG